jgi:hypothetical protein
MEPVDSLSTGQNRGNHPAFFIGGDEGPRVSRDEVRRHYYRRDGRPVRVKIKRKDGSYVNWYRVQSSNGEGWQPLKPDDYKSCPYVGSLEAFDRELEGDQLLWPEGEKDCDTLSNLGIAAFTFGGTGDGLPDGASSYLQGRHVVILADNDPPGRKHADKKAAIAHPVAASVRVIEFPELPPKGDVTDYLKTATVHDLQSRIEAASPWRPSETNGSFTCSEKFGRSLVTCCLAEVAPEKIEWLWPGRIAVGKLTMIAGEPGLGKSQVAIFIASAVTTGNTWPDSATVASAGNVIILSAEDGLADTTRPRFDAAGGDPTRVRVVRAVETAANGAKARGSFNLGADLLLLEEQIRSFGDVRLIIIDPLSSYMGNVDSHKNTDVRAVLEPISEMAERLRVAVLAITHLSKGDGRAINRFVGSIAFVAAARAAFAVVSDPDDDSRSRRLLLQVKNNIAPLQPGLAFRVEQHEVAPGIVGSAISWDDAAPVTMTADQALTARADRGTTTAKDDAVEFLREVLANGPVDVLDIEAEARSGAMLSNTRRLKENKPFRDAAKALGVVKKRLGFGPGARMQWSLPDHEGAS